MPRLSPRKSGDSVVPNPKALDVSAEAFGAVRRRPTFTAPTLLDITMTSESESVPYRCPWASRITRAPIVIVPFPVSIRSVGRRTFSSSAADPVTILNVDPGS